MLESLKDALKSLTSDPLSPVSLVTAAALAGIGLWSYSRLTAKPKYSANVQYPRGHLPVLGSAVTFALRKDDMLDWITEECERLNWQPWLFKIPGQYPFIVVTSPEAVQHVLKTEFETFIKGPWFEDKFRQLLGGGIFNADGESWFMQRKIASRIFTTNAFRRFTETVFTEEMNSLIEKLKGLHDDEVVDLSDLFFRFTLDSFTVIGFGTHLGVMKKDGKEPFAAAFDRAQATTNLRFFSVAWWIEELIKLPVFLQMRADIATIDELAYQIINNRRNQPAHVREQQHDLLSLFMAVQLDDGSSLTNKQLRDVVLNFILAGRDTTAQALSWCIYYLNKYPATLAKLQHEIDTTLGHAVMHPTYDQVKNMKYANAVFHEALRLSPSVPKNGKYVTRTTVFPDGTRLERDTVAVLSPYAMARNPNIWGPNAREFVPERWLNESVTINQFEYPVFNAGPRICIGKSLAELEGVYVLASLLRHFTVQVLDIDKITYANSLTLPMKNGMRCRITKRTK